MATVYSLVCWGGRTGKTVSISASTDVVTLTNHGLRNGAKLWPSGTLPAELNASTPVYARSTAANTFTLHTSAAGAIANTGQILFAGSSTYAAVTLKSDLVASPSTALSAYGLSDLSRWGASGSERIYDSLPSWTTARTSLASEYIHEVCEIGEAFFDNTSTWSFTMAVNGLTTLISTKINNIRTPAFHYGVVGAGYVFSLEYDNGGEVISLGNYRKTLDGFTVKSLGTGNISGIRLGINSGINRMIVQGYNNKGSGVIFAGIGSYAKNCLSIGFSDGLMVNYNIAAVYCANNTATKNNVGFNVASSAIAGFFYNNVSVGNNTTNWGTITFGPEGADKNAGLSGEAWMAPGKTRITLATADFADYPNNNFKPNSAASPQVDAGVAYYDQNTSDISDSEVPNYNNGSVEGIDVGCYEFDHGYGPHPASTTVIFDGVVAGSEIHIYDSAGNELVGVESCDANHALTWSIPANPVVVVTIIKRGLRWQKFSYTSKVGNQSIPIFQNTDLGYNNPT